MIYKPAKPNTENTCNWQQLSNGKWQPGCLLNWTTENHPYNSGKSHCPQCGKIIAKPWGIMPLISQPVKSVDPYEFIMKGAVDSLSL